MVSSFPRLIINPHLATGPGVHLGMVTSLHLEPTLQQDPPAKLNDMPFP